MSTRNRIALGAAILLLSPGIACNASAGGGEQQVCDVGADYALGVEDHSEAIPLHTEVVRRIRTTRSLIIIWVLPKE
jgi:hypothetical protein